MYIPLLRSLATANPTSPTASPSSSASTSSSSSTDGTDGLDTMFLQLLTAQLQNQSPLDPLDPNQFVVQLAQFQSLSELTQIATDMQTLVSDIAPSSSSSGDAQPSTAAVSPNSTASLNPILH